MRDMDDIRAFCVEIRRLMEHAPGPEWCDVDEEAWKLLIGICKRISDKGTRFRTTDKQGWTAEAWQMFFFIRNSEFRPKWDKAEARLRELFAMQVLPGNEADVRRVVRAPEPPQHPQIEQRQQLMLGGASADDTAPAWLDEFPSKDAGGPFDQVLLRPMMHLSDHEARKVCRIIKAENARHEQEKVVRNTPVPAQLDEQERLRKRLANSVRKLQKGV